MAPRPNKKRANQTSSEGYDLASGSSSKKRRSRDPSCSLKKMCTPCTPIIKIVNRCPPSKSKSKGRAAKSSKKRSGSTKKRSQSRAKSSKNDKKKGTSQNRGKSSSIRSKSFKNRGKSSSSKSSKNNDRFLALKGRKRKRCRPPGTFADYVRDYWKAKKKANKDYNKSIAEACRDAAKCWRKLTVLQRRYYQKRYCGQYQKMKKLGTFCARRYPRKKKTMKMIKKRSHKKRD